jgi:hypothetical protein
MPDDQPVPPDAPPELIDFCNKVIRPDLPGVSLGNCVSFFLTYAKGVPGYIPAHCKEYLYFDPDAFKLEFTNLGKCVMKRQQERDKNG